MADQAFGSEDLYNAACDIAKQQRLSLASASRERSRATHVSYVLADSNGLPIRRIPIGDVLRRAEENQTRKALPLNNGQTKQREGFLAKHDREQYEAAIFHAVINGLMRSTDTPSQSQSGAIPGLSGDFVIRDEKGNFLAQVDNWSIARAQQTSKDKAKIRKAIGAGRHEKTIQILSRTLGGKLTFHSGFWTGEALATEWNTIISMAPPFEEIDMKCIAEVHVLDSQNEKDMGQAIVTSAIAGATLGLLTGGLGLIGAGAGLLAGGNTSNKLIRIVLADGRQSLLTTPAKTYSKILALTLSTKEAATVQQQLSARVLPPPPPPPPLPESWARNTRLKSKNEPEVPALKPGQIQFLKKVLDAPLTRELLDYYKNIKYYQELVEGDVEEFVLGLSNDGYICEASDNSESWTCTEKGKQAATWLINHARTSEEELKKELSSLNANESLKIATELKRDGNLNAAIKALEISYEKIAKSTTTYKLETFLRISAYLQAAGRSDEAWEYLNKLLAKGYPNQINSDWVKARDRSAIYDSMSKFLHKESKHHQAITLQSLSLITWAQYHYLRAKEYNKQYESDLRKEAKEEFMQWSRPVKVLESLQRSIPKKCDNFELGEVVIRICELLRDPERIKYDIAFAEIDRIVHAHNKKVD